MAYWLLFFLVSVVALAWFRPGIRATSLVLGAVTLFYGVFGGQWLIFVVMMVVGAIVFVPLNLAVLRQEWLSRPLFAGFRRVVSRLDERQLAAIAGGGAGWEAELFNGQPDWPRFHEDYAARVMPDERALIGGPVAEFCSRFARDPDAPDAVARLRAYGLYGLGIESLHGGAELSAIAQAAALGQLSAGAGSRVALKVGSSARLGWIELLRRHGTPAQQSRFLPLLAGGATLQANDVALAGDARIGNGPEGLALILELDLAIDADAELVGLRVDIRDPDRRLQRDESRGATLLLVEAGTLRTRDRKAVVPFDAIIGDRERLGCADADSSECRAVADAIAPGAIHAGAVTALALAAGSAARLRAPFATRLGERALVQEALATLAARAYAAQALAAATARAVDLGEKPLGPAAFARTLALDQARQCRAAAVDLGLERSSLNRLIGALYEVGKESPEPPMLTRPDRYSACVLRSHNSFMQALIADSTPNPALALERFDTALWSHVGQVFGNAVRALALGLTTGGRRFGGGSPETATMRRINRYSAALAFAADVSLSLLASELGSRKPYTAMRGVREASRRTLTTWLGDALAQLYLVSAALRQFDQGGANPAERALLELTCIDAFGAVEEALDRVLRHLSSPTLGWLTRLIVLPLGHSRLSPSEAMQRTVATQLQIDGPLRERLALRSGLPADAATWPLVEAALEAARAAESVEQRAAQATNADAPRHAPTRIAQAEASGAITAEEAAQLREWLAAVSRFQRQGHQAARPADSGATGSEA